MNWSWESGSKDPSVDAVITHGRELIIAAAGNAPRNLATQNVFPANYSRSNGAVLISVAALVPGNGLASFSGRGPSVTIAAPGCGVPTFREGGLVVKDSGTSISAPLVTLTATIIKTLNQNADPLKIYNRIVATAYRDAALLKPEVVSGGRVLDIPAAISIFDDLVRLKNGTIIEGKLGGRAAFAITSGDAVQLTDRIIYAIHDIGEIQSDGTRPAKAMIAKPGERLMEVDGTLSGFEFKSTTAGDIDVDVPLSRVSDILPAMWRDPIAIFAKTSS